MKNFIVLLVLGCSLHPAITYAQSRDVIKIHQLLEQQTHSWNSGNIDAFMEGYWKDDSLQFIGKSGVTYGWQKTLNNYKKGYPDTAAMGKLDFIILHTKMLSSEYYFVTGKWHLSRRIGDLNGMFTLLFRKIKNRWLIIADHSS